MMNTKQPKILLLVTGSIAAVKVHDVIRDLVAHGVNVTCILTEGGKQFVTPLSLAALSGNAVYDTLFSLKDETEMGHIRLSREADVVAVVPASADFLAKMAHGMCNDLASAVVMASDKSVTVAPAMNLQMWGHPATKRNVKLLKKDGVQFVGPVAGELACGETGVGRMAEAEDIVSALLQQLDALAESNIFLLRDLPLRGMKAVVTSGPTREKLDPVRYMSNHSSGKQGYAIAAALLQAGAEVTLVSGPTHIDPPQGVEMRWVESAQEMYDAVHGELPCDIAVCCAAVADWRAMEVADHKIKKNGDEQPTFTFAENPDILVSLAKHKTQRPKLVIGFAAETEHVIENARVKLERKKCDWIVANDVLANQVFGADDNTVHLVLADVEEAWGKSSKSDVAKRLVARIIDSFKDGKKGKKRSKA